MKTGANGPDKQSASIGAEGEVARRGALLDWAGPFSAVFTVLAAFLNGDLRWKSAIALVGGASALFLVLAARRHNPRRQGLIVAGAVMFVALVVLAVVVAPLGSSGTAASGSSLTARSPFIAKRDYVLRPSSSIDTNDQDKVDLDTGCPGWGNYPLLIGPSRCGERADVIADEEGIHNADGGPSLYKLTTTLNPNFDSCVAALNAEPDRGVGQLDITNLKAGDQICVRTDKRNVALVVVDAVTTDARDELAKVTISFTVWKS